MSCEHCWALAQALGTDYSAELLRAERENAPCTRDDEDGARLRAGQFWDADRKIDRRAALLAQKNGA